MENELHSRIRAAFGFRNDQDKESFVKSTFGVFDEFRAYEKQIPPERTVEQRDLERDVDLLRISYHRFMGDGASAERLSATVFQKLEAGDYRPDFKVFSEKGLNLLFLRQPAEAFENFIIARRYARDADLPESECSALINQLACLDALGLPNAKTKHELFALYSTLRMPPEKGLRAQVETYRVYDAFAQGDFATIAANLSDPACAGQALYLALYYAKLPYTKLCVPTPQLQSQTLRLTEEGAPFRLPFKLNTLRGVHENEGDRDGLRAIEFAERLYFWVWIFLESLRASDLVRVHALLEQGLAQFSFENLPLSSRGEISLALRWLRLLVPEAKTIANLALGRLGSLDFSGHRVFLDESEALRIYEYGSRDDYAFAENFLSAAACTRLRARLRDGPSAGSRISGASPALRSPPLRRALRMLADRAEIPFEDFACEVFGIKNFSTGAHTQRIHNLLQQVKKISGQSNVLSTKAGIIRRQAGFPEIEWAASHGDANSALDWNGLFRPKPMPRPMPTLAERFTLNEWMTVTGQPKTSALRFLQSAIESGFVHREGRARGTRYRITQPNPFQRLVQELDL